MATQDGKETVTLITTFIVPAAMEEAFLVWWRMTRMMMNAQPGFLAATLHRSLDQRERYRFINVAEWRSSEAERSAMSAIWSSVPKPPIPGFDWHPALYEVIEES